MLDVACAERPEVSALVRPRSRVPAGASVADALPLMRGAKQQFAAVMGEDGRAVGIVTAKDLVEEIVGELDAW